MKRYPKLTGILLAAGLGVAGIIASPVAQAANQYTVNANVPKPSVCNNSGTIAAGGWLANKPCGYIVGTARAGTRFDVNFSTSSNFHFGRTRDTDGTNFCAWLVPGALNLGTRTTVADSCGTSTSDTVVHRLAIGRDFDNEPHVGNGASTIPVNAAGCTGYYNYFTDSTYATGRLRDAVGFTLPSTGAYRYSSRDSQAAMIRVGTGDSTTWLFVARSCINAQLAGYALHNEND